MKRVISSSELFKLFNPQTRQAIFPHVTWKHMHHAARNLAIAMNALHVDKYVMGDVNQKNFLVTKKMLMIAIDTDSFQVRSPSGRVFRCTVGVPDYTPPEIQAIGRYDTIDREFHHDNFGLAVLIFQLLMEGRWPFTGTPRNVNRSYHWTYCLKHGIFPYKPNRLFSPPSSAPDFDILHPEVRQLFLRCFVDGYHNYIQRPTAKEWIDTLDRARKSLKQCRRDNSHWYQSHLGNKCPWCAQARATSPLVVPKQYRSPSASPRQTATQHYRPFPRLPRSITPPQKRLYLTLAAIISIVILLGLLDTKVFSRLDTNDESPFSEVGDSISARPMQSDMSVPENDGQQTNSVSRSTSRSARQPTVTLVPTRRPTNTPRPFSCPGAAPTRLYVGGRGRVLPSSEGPNKLQDTPGEPSARKHIKTIALIDAGDTFRVLEGPVCEAGVAWWRVEWREITRGWTGEMRGYDYWVEPVR